MYSFDISPYVGAKPVHFGTPRNCVIEYLGTPDVVDTSDDSWGSQLEINIGYTDNNLVRHIGLRPGDYELKLDGKVIWTPTDHPDPNPSFLLLDSEPLEYLGFLIFTKIGIRTTGYHDDDPDNVSVVLFEKGATDKFLPKAKRPDLSKYGK